MATPSDRPSNKSTRPMRHCMWQSRKVATMTRTMPGPTTYSFKRARAANHARQSNSLFDKFVMSRCHKVVHKFLSSW